MTETNPAQRQLPFRAPLTVALVLLSVAFLFLGLRGLLLPSAGAVSLGAEIRDGADLWLMQTTAARNIGLSLLALSFVAFDLRLAFGLLLAAATAISGLDLWIVSNAAGLGHAVKHAGYFVVLALFAALTLRIRS